MRGDNWELSLLHFLYTVLSNEHCTSCFFTLWEPKVFVRSLCPSWRGSKRSTESTKVWLYFNIALQLSLRTSSHCVVCFYLGCCLENWRFPLTFSGIFYRTLELLSTSNTCPSSCNFLPYLYQCLKEILRVLFFSTYHFTQRFWQQCCNSASLYWWPLIKNLFLFVLAFFPSLRFLDRRL